MSITVANPVRRINEVPVYVVGEYQGALRTIIRCAKNRGARSAIRPFAPQLRSFGRRFAGAVAIPIPSSGLGWRARGYSLASDAARFTGLNVEQALRFVSARGQKGRRAEDRWTNRHMVARSTRQQDVIVVDDVITTGATAAAAIAALREQGHRVHAVIAIASVPTRQ